MPKDRQTKIGNVKDRQIRFLTKNDFHNRKVQKIYIKNWKKLSDVGKKWQCQKDRQRSPNKIAKDRQNFRVYQIIRYYYILLLYYINEERKTISQ